MLSHVLRVKGSVVQPCKGKIHPDAHKRYMTLHKKSKLKSETCKWVSDNIVNNVVGPQQYATESLQSFCKKQLFNQIIDANQMCFEVGFERAVSTDIAGLEMAMADFFHYENIPDNPMKLYWFKKMLQQAWLVGIDFKIPNRRKIGGNFFYFYISCLTAKTSLPLIFFQVYYLISTTKTPTKK